jgi:DNA-directed RNA polymerase omega subunit
MSERQGEKMIDRSKLPNSFEFVVTAGARARQLLAGSVPKVEVGEHKKTTVAQREVLSGAVEGTAELTAEAQVEQP